MSQVHVAHVNRCHAALQLFSKGPILPPGCPARIGVPSGLLFVSHIRVLACFMHPHTVAAISDSQPCLQSTAWVLLSLLPLPLTLTRSLPHAHAHARSMPGHRRVVRVRTRPFLFPPYDTCTPLPYPAPSLPFPFLQHSTTLPPFLSPSHIAVSPVCHSPCPLPAILQAVGALHP